MNYFIRIVFILGVLFNFYTAGYTYEKIKNQEENYVIYLPKAIENNHAKVLVILHGWGMSFKQEVERWEFNAEKKKFIIIGFDINYGDIKTDADIADIYNKIEKAIGELNTKYKIDIDKVYTAGTSAGGMLAINLLLRYPDSFYSCASISGSKLRRFDSGQYIFNAKGKKFYLFHGDKDKVVSVNETYIAEKELKENEGMVEIFIFENGGHTLNSEAYSKAVTKLANDN
ncbi:MAG: alpha/beta hydrolase-fold protein [Endomicrobia bacterium]|nr:alpha/beta hydrolase-fold protein [Endomicrobiia bacterium]